MSEKDQKSQESREVENMPTLDDGHDKKFRELAEAIGSRADSIESEVDLALSPQETKGLWKKGIDKIKQIFSKEGIDIVKTLSKIDTLETALENIIDDENLDVSEDGVTEIANLLKQLDRIKTKISELEEKLEMDTISYKVEDVERKILEDIDQEFDFDDYKDASTEVYGWISEKERELRALYGDDYDFENDIDYEELAAIHREMTDLLHEMETRKQLLIKAETIIAKNVHDSDDSRAMHDYAELLEEVKVLDEFADADFEVPSDMKDVLEEHLSIIEKLKKEIKELTVEFEEYLEDAEEEEGAEEDVELVDEISTEEDEVAENDIEEKKEESEPVSSEAAENNLLEKLENLAIGDVLLGKGKIHFELVGIDDGKFTFKILQTGENFEKDAKVFRQDVEDGAIAEILTGEEAVAKKAEILSESKEENEEDVSFFEEKNPKESGPRVSLDDLAEVENSDDKLLEKLQNLKVGDIMVNKGANREVLKIDGDVLTLRDVDTGKIFSRNMDDARQGIEDGILLDILSGEEAAAENSDSDSEEVASEEEEGLGELAEENIEEENNPDLKKAREEYFAALGDRRSVVSSKRKLGIFAYKGKKEDEFEEIKQKYETLLQGEQKAKLEAKLAELKSAAASEGEIPKELFDEYLELLENEENKIDSIATSSERSGFKKFQGWWRRHAKTRLIIGVGVGVTGLAASAIPALGLGAVSALFGATAFVAARGVASGGGSYMAAEAAMDIGTKKLGQRGIIDDETKIGLRRSLSEIRANMNLFKKGKGLFESQKEIDKIIEAAENGDNVFEKYSVDQLRTELARLRALSLDKGVELNQAGRLGAMHGELINLLTETYHEKLKLELEEKFVDPETTIDKAKITLDVLNETIDREIESAQEDLVSQADIDRKKKIARHSTAAALGLATGLMVGTGTSKHLIDKMRGVDSSDPSTGVATPDVSEKPSAIDHAFAKLGHKVREMSIGHNDDVTPPDNVSSPDNVTSATADTMTTSEPRNIFGRVGKLFGAHHDSAVDSSGVATADTSGVHTVESDTISTAGHVSETTTPEAAASTVDNATEATTAAGSAEHATEAINTPENTHNGFSDIINSDEVKGSDSIWKSTRSIFEKHATELGYKGDLNDVEAVSKWAETQTANAVSGLNAEQGGNLADLVHDGDMVKIDMIDGKAHLSFSDSSGIEAGHLSDTNVSKLMEGQDFNEGVEHSVHIDTDTGDQYIEIKSGEDVYKIYDWDRDGEPNVVMPDGTQQEMSVGELKETLTTKELINPPIDTSAPDVPVEGSAEFTDDALQEILKSNDSGHIQEYLSDYVENKGWPEDKVRVFLSSLRDPAGKINANLGGVFDDPNNISNEDLNERLLQAFDTKVVKDDFAELNNVDAGHPIPIKVGDHYYIAEKIDRAWRKDVFVVDTVGELKPEDQITASQSGMKEAFKIGSLEKLKETANFREVGGVSTADTSVHVDSPVQGDSASDFQEVGGVANESVPSSETSADNTVDVSTSSSVEQPSEVTNVNQEIAPLEAAPEIAPEASNENISAALQDLNKVYFEDGKSYTIEGVINLKGDVMDKLKDALTKTVKVLEQNPNADQAKLAGYKEILERISSKG